MRLCASREGGEPLGTLLVISEVDHDASLDVAVMHAREDVVDVLERSRGDGRLDLALAGEVQGFLQVESRSDDRAAHGDAVQHGVEDRQREVARRQAD